MCTSNLQEMLKSNRICWTKNYPYPSYRCKKLWEHGSQKLIKLAANFKIICKCSVLWLKTMLIYDNYCFLFTKLSNNQFTLSHSLTNFCEHKLISIKKLPNILVFNLHSQKVKNWLHLCPYPYPFPYHYQKPL